MAKGTLVRVSENTKETLTLLAAKIQTQRRRKISADMAIRVAIEIAFPELAKEMGIDTFKELMEKKEGDD
jgi:hypothetical protein